MKRRKGPLADRISNLPPTAILALSYFSAILLGAFLLWLPIATIDQPVTPLQAIFTATSAITVTGLVVVDTGSTYTYFGQMVILILIQLGGLGLMSFAMMVASAFGLQVGIKSGNYLREDLNRRNMLKIKDLVSVVLWVSVLCELAGAVLIAPSFIREAGLARGLWEAVFHSISAFNNAGFSTYGDSLTRFATDPLVMSVIPALFIIGGLGYAVVREVVFVRSPSRWTLHTKVMLLGTAVLIVWAVTLFAIIEWRNPATLGKFAGFWDKLIVSWFQGVTMRTAGFNSIDIGAMHDSTSLMFVTLMLIGGGPTSTAGGIKVTTFVVMVLATIAFLRRQSEISLFRRRIGTEEMLKATAIVAITMLVCVSAMFILVISHDGDFMDIVFEVASAFGTVGLTRNYTGELNTLGQIAIIFVMFVGRVGPLTLGFFIATRSRPRVRYANGDISIG